MSSSDKKSSRDDDIEQVVRSIRWLQGKTSPAVSREIAEDLARPDGRMQRAFVEFNKSCKRLYKTVNSDGNKTHSYYQETLGRSTNAIAPSDETIPLVVFTGGLKGSTHQRPPRKRSLVLIGLAAAAAVAVIFFNPWIWRNPLQTQTAKTSPKVVPTATEEKPTRALPEPKTHDQDKALVTQGPTSKKSVTPKPPRQPEPSPPAVVTDEEWDQLEAQITAMNKKFPLDVPLNVVGSDERGLSERIVEYRKDHPERETTAMLAFVERARVTPEHIERYVIYRANQLKGTPESHPDVQDLWKAADRLSDERIAGNPELKAWMLKNRPGTPEGVQKTLRVELAGLVAQSPAALNRPQGQSYLLSHISPASLRNEALDVHTRVRLFAMAHPELIDERLEEFLMRTRRPVIGDELGIIVTTSVANPDDFNPSGPIGLGHWNRLINSGRGAGFPVTAVMNIVIDPNQQSAAVVDTIDKANSASIIMLACLDCRPVLGKSVESLKREINAWLTLYPKIDGFFIYNAPVNDMASIYRYLRSDLRLALGIVNFAPSFPPEDTIRLTGDDDHFVVCVDQSGMPVTNFKPPDWIAKYNPNRFAGVFLGTQANLAASIDLAAAKHLGGVFITDNGLELPAFLPDQMELIQNFNVRVRGADNAVKPAVKRNRAAIPKRK